MRCRWRWALQRRPPSNNVLTNSARTWKKLCKRCSTMNRIDYHPSQHRCRRYHRRRWVGSRTPLDTYPQVRRRRPRPSYHRPPLTVFKALTRVVSRSSFSPICSRYRFSMHVLKFPDLRSFSSPPTNQLYHSFNLEDHSHLRSDLCRISFVSPADAKQSWPTTNRSISRGSVVARGQGYGANARNVRQSFSEAPAAAPATTSD